MKLFNTGSRRFLVNLFADFILNELDPFNKLSLIQVTDCKNFLVIGGKSESKNILDLSDLKNKFYEKYKVYFNDIEILKMNIIDLIIYDTKPEIPNNITFGNFYNNNRPIYHLSQIESNIDKFSYNEYNEGLMTICESKDSKYADDHISPESLHVSSEFPHGYSINNLRNKLYYSEYVSLNLFSITGISRIKLKWSNEEIDLWSDSFIENDHVNSIMKDVFDFNLITFNEKIKEYHILNDILLPLHEKPWLVNDKVNQLFIT